MHWHLLKYPLTESSQTYIKVDLSSVLCQPSLFIPNKLSLSIFIRSLSLTSMMRQPLSHPGLHFSLADEGFRTFGVNPWSIKTCLSIKTKMFLAYTTEDQGILAPLSGTALIQGLL